MRMNRIAALTLSAGLITMAACSDAPTATPSAAAFAPKTSSFALGVTTDATAQVGRLKICKTGNIGGSFDVTSVREGGGSGGSVSGLNTAIANNTCYVVAEDFGTTGGLRVALSEDAAANVVSTVTACTFVGTSGVPSACTPLTLMGAEAGGRFVNNFHGFVITVNNTFTAPPTGNQGCTPGYWKQDQHFGNWEVPLTKTFLQAGMNFGYTGLILDGLGANGGGVNALARHAGAAYLNSLTNSGVNFAYTTAQVVAIANGTGAYAGLSIEARKDLLAAANEGVGGCPLGRAEL